MKRVSSDIRRKQRVRAQIRKKGGGRVRLSVHRSGKHMYAQLIDDAKGKTVAAASTLDKAVRDKLSGASGSTIASAKAVGAMIGERAKQAKIDEVVFDRGGFLYHGRIKALADGAREAGLKF